MNCDFPLTPRMKTVLAKAAEVALEFGHEWIGTEHILIALFREPDGIAGQFFKSRNIEIENAIAFVKCTTPTKA